MASTGFGEDWDVVASEVDGSEVLPMNPAGVAHRPGVVGPVPQANRTPDSAPDKNGPRSMPS